MKVGDLDEIEILTLTSPLDKIGVNSDRLQNINSLRYMKSIYMSLAKSFTPYSEHMILYYLYCRKGITSTIRIKELALLCGDFSLDDDLDLNSLYNTDASSSSSQEILISNKKNQNKLNSNQDQDQTNQISLSTTNRNSFYFCVK